MAYIQNREDDEEQQGQLAVNALDRTGGAGVLGGNVSSSNSATPSAAPTNSGSHFVNLQRYLEQNPMTDVGGKIGGLADKTIGSAMDAFTKGTEGLRGYVENKLPGSMDDYSSPTTIKELLDASENDPRKRMKLSQIFQGTQGWDDPGDTSVEPTPELKRIASIIGQPYTPRNSMTYDTEGKPTGKSVSSLPYELAQDKPIYTPGQEALDIALFSSKGDVAGAVDRNSKKLTDTTDNITKGVSDLNASAAKIRDNFIKQTAAAKIAGKQLYDENLPKFARLTDDVGGLKGGINDSDVDRWGRLANLIGQDYQTDVSNYQKANPRSKIEINEKPSLKSGEGPSTNWGVLTQYFPKPVFNGDGSFTALGKQMDVNSAEGQETLAQYYGDNWRETLKDYIGG